MKAARLKPITPKKRYGLKAFLLGVLISFLIFSPFLIYDNGLFLYYGDFNVQQVSFYQLIHDSIRSGNIGWSHTTDLGANIIGSYSFYLLGSPFFWLTVPFPGEAVPYLMAPLLMLKMGCASFSAYIYLRRYVHNKGFAVLGGLLYAFSGFSIFNIFFNHFHEAMIMFPLLLAALDEYMDSGRRGILALAVFGSCFVNYYFFVGQVVFVIIYWFVRVFTYSYKVTLKGFLLMVFEVVLGFAATAVILLPSVLVVSENNRVSVNLKGWNAVVYSSPQRYMNILESFFFPPDIPAYPNFTPDSNTKWGSLSAWLPLINVTGVIAFMQKKSYKHWLKKMIPILVLFAFVPILNSIFQLFNAQYYARWFYMLILMLVLATVMAFEDIETDWKRAILWSGGITVGIAALIGFMPSEGKDEYGNTIDKLGLMQYPVRFWIYVAISLIGLLIFVLLVRLLKTNRKKFIKLTSYCMGAVIVLSSIFILGLGKGYGYDSHNYIIPYVLNKGNNIDLPETDNVRSDFYEAMDNSAMFWQLPSIQAFHSIVPESIMEFYPTIGVPRDVASRPEVKYYGLRSFTSTRWLFDYSKDSNSFTNSNGNTAMPGWKYYGKQNEFDIWENEYYIPMGFTYDSYIAREVYDGCNESNRNLLLLKSMVLTDEQIEKYSDITGGKSADISKYSYTQDEYFKDCINRRETACSYFKYDNNGFSASIDLKGKSDTLLFFSVPYEKGWSAQVNGQDVEIERVNVGFMAVRVKGGNVNEIRFNYETPGLKTGLIVTISCIIIFAGYMLIWGRKKNREINSIRKPAVFRAGSRFTVKAAQNKEEIQNEKIKESAETIENIMDKEKGED